MIITFLFHLFHCLYLIILLGFAWSALVSYSKKLHLRTMKPAGLPPMKDTAGLPPMNDTAGLPHMKDTAGLPHIQHNKKGKKGQGGSKRMSDLNMNAYRFPTKQGDTLPTIS